LYRDVNENVLRINDAFSIVATLDDWICECANQNCSQRLELSLSEYDAIRASPIRFLVAPDEEHFFPELEVVTEKNERFWVVEKTGTAGEVAEKADPRRTELHT
jgi:hypothetical protein